MWHAIFNFLNVVLVQIFPFVRFEENTYFVTELFVATDMMLKNVISAYNNKLIKEKEKRGTFLRSPY